MGTTVTGLLASIFISPTPVILEFSLIKSAVISIFSILLSIFTLYVYISELNLLIASLLR